MRSEEFRTKPYYTSYFILSTSYFSSSFARSAATIEEYSEAEPKSFFLNSSLLTPNS